MLIQTHDGEVAHGLTTARFHNQRVQEPEHIQVREKLDMSDGTG